MSNHPMNLVSEAREAARKLLDKANLVGLAGVDEFDAARLLTRLADHIEAAPTAPGPEAGFSITVWRDGTWKVWQPLDGQYAQDESDWLVTIQSSEIEAERGLQLSRRAPTPPAGPALREQGRVFFHDFMGSDSYDRCDPMREEAFIERFVRYARLAALRPAPVADDVVALVNEFQRAVENNSGAEPSLSVMLRAKEHLVRAMIAATDKE